METESKIKTKATFLAGIKVIFWKMLLPFTIIVSIIGSVIFGPYYFYALNMLILDEEAIVTTGEQWLYGVGFLIIWACVIGAVYIIILCIIWCCKQVKYWFKGIVETFKEDQIKIDKELTIDAQIKKQKELDRQKLEVKKGSLSINTFPDGGLSLTEKEG